MNKYNTKEAIFKAWDELIFLIEYLETITEQKEIIRELKETQLLKKEKWETFYERKIWNEIDFQQLISDDSMVTKTLILKWEEIIIESFYYLQFARRMGGTMGHKVGPIWTFHKVQKEKYEKTILNINL